MESSFLPEKDWQLLFDSSPDKEQWKKSVVYDRHVGKDRVAKDVRHADKCTVIDHAWISNVERLLTRALLPRLREKPGFLYCWPRGHRGTEWLRYEPGMFFRSHTDFERYVCGGLVPCVCLVGMRDVAKGGETQVGKTRCVGGARRNGAVFFAANELHEARPVLEGHKLCLKMEFFVLVETTLPDRLLRVEDDQQRWRSVWSTTALNVVDSYLRSHCSFEGGKDRLVVSTPLAQELQKLMMAIAEKRERECEEIFPTLSTSFLHDVFCCLSAFSTAATATATQTILGTDEQAWEFLNTQTLPLPPTLCLLVGIWYRKTGQKRYKLYEVYSRQGDRHMQYFKNSISRTSSTNEYCSYSSLRQHAVETFIDEKDMTPLSKNLTLDTTQKLSGTDLPWTRHTEKMNWRSVFRDIEPSDRVERNQRQHGMASTIVSEMCNDEDAGTTTETYERYVSYDLQIRWIAHIALPTSK